MVPPKWLLGIMLGEVARIMGRPISPGAIQVSPPNHPVTVLNWYSLTLMLTGQPAPKREAFRHCVVSGQPPMEIPELIALDAHCHLRQLEHRETAGQGRGAGQSMFRTDPVRAWEETFLGWRGSNDIQLLAVIDNRVFPQELQRPHMRGVTVGHRTIVVKTTYGAHPRLAKTFTDNAWGQLSAMIYSVDCCAVGECGLDYTEPVSSLPAQRRLFQKQIVIAESLRKPLVLHLRPGKGHNMSAVMGEALTMLKQHTYRQQQIHLHCYTGDLANYTKWIGIFPNTVFGVTAKTTQATGYSDLASHMDLSRLVLETLQCYPGPVGIPTMW